VSILRDLLPDTLFLYMFNPVIPGTSPDPSICYSKGYYYLVNSSFRYFPGLPLYYSKDLQNWHFLTNCLNRSKQLDFSGFNYSSELFAATIRYINNCFYIITTDWRGRGNFFVKARNPAGPWSDPVLIEKSPADPQKLHFDPSLFQDRDGTIYYTRRGKKGIDQAIINLETGKLRHKPRQICTGFCSWDIEGPHLYRINNYYYLLAAEGGSRYGHMVTVSRSRTPWGPFKPCPRNPVLTHRHISMAHFRDTGHGDIIKTAAGKWFILFHATRNYSYNSFAHLGRETCILPLKWTKDKWPLIGSRGTMPDKGAFNRPALLPAQKTTFTDKFTGSKLNKAYVSPYKRQKRYIKIQQNKLHLWGNKYSLRNKLPVMLGFKQRQFDFVWETSLSFNPRYAEEEAGLVLYVNPDYYYACSVKKQHKQKSCVLTRQIGDIHYVQNSLPIKAGETLKIKIRGGTDHYKFYISTTANYKTLGKAQTKFLSPEINGSWTGVFLMLFASGNGRKCKTPALFSFNKYQDL